jgi:predicted transcriptional regulator
MSVYHARFLLLTDFVFCFSVPVKDNYNMPDIRSIEVEGSNLLSLFTEFGLTRQEGEVYLALLLEGSLNGYEIAKSTGISRSNAYTALASLVEKGAAWIVDGTPTRYKAVPSGEFTDNRIRAMQRTRERLLANLPSAKDHSGGYITIRGRVHVLDKLRHLLLGVEMRVYLSLDADLVAYFAEELAAVANSGKKVVVITEGTGLIGGRPLAEVIPGAAVHSAAIVPGEIRAIVDSRYALTGNLSGGDDSSCLFSDERNFVELFRTALKNEIRLAEIDAGGQA